MKQQLCKKKSERAKLHKKGRGLSSAKRQMNNKVKKEKEGRNKQKALMNQGGCCFLFECSTLKPRIQVQPAGVLGVGKRKEERRGEQHTM